jgi:hypothetical protein
VSFDSSDEFSKWFSNPEQKSVREKAMLMSGIPLEIKARRFLANNGYRITRWYYPTDQETGRELDFVAEKVLGNYTFPLSESPYPDFPIGSQVDFWIVILGECKRSSTNDFFAFKAEGEQVGRTLKFTRFPIPFYRQMNAPPFTLVTGSLSSLMLPLMPFYSFPFITDRIVEVDAAHFQTRQNDNYGDKMTHEACEKLLAASINLKENYQFSMDMETRELFRSLQEDYVEISKKMPTSASREIAKKLVEIDAKRAWKKLPYLSIGWGVPLMVLDDNRGLISTNLRKDGTVEFKEDIGLALYPYVSENIRNFQKIGARGSFPVIICKNSSLPEGLKIIETGTDKLIERFTTYLKDSPERLIEDLLAAEVEQERKTETTSDTK